MKVPPAFITAPLALIVSLGLGGDALASSPREEARVKLVVRESVLARPHIMVNPATMVFSPDAMHVAYTLLKGRRQAVCLDGVEQGTYDHVDALHFSPDGKRLAFWAMEKGMRRVIADSKEGKLYNASWEWQRTALMVTNADVQFCQFPLDLTFSPDSKRLAYVGALSEDKKPRVVLDGEEIGLHEGLVDCGLVFSPDSQRLAYVARQGTNFVPIIDRQPGRSYDEGVILTPSGLSADGKRFAYFARTEGRQLVIVDGTEVGPFEQVGVASLTFSPDSRQLAFKFSRGDLSYVWRDGREEGGFESIAGIAFSPDSQRFTYLARRGGKWVAVLDGQESKSNDGIVGLLTFSPDSKRLAYAVRSGENAMIVADEQEGKPYRQAQEVRLRFSPDSKHLACSVQRPSGSLLVIDSTEGPEYDAIFEFAFTSPTSLRLLARRYDPMAQPEIIRVEVTIEEQR